MYHWRSYRSAATVTTTTSSYVIKLDVFTENVTTAVKDPCPCFVTIVPVTSVQDAQMICFPSATAVHSVLSLCQYSVTLCSAVLYTLTIAVSHPFPPWLLLYRTQGILPCVKAVLQRLIVVKSAVRIITFFLHISNHSKQSPRLLSLSLLVDLKMGQITNTEYAV